MSWTFRGASTASVLALVAVNAIPLVGVLLWDWSVPAILVLYWVESGIVGAINALKMARAEGPAPTALGPRTRLELLRSGGLTMRGADGADVPRAALIGFFLFHYGIFWFAHGMFVTSFFGTSGPGDVSPATLAPAAAGLALSHLLSYRTNYIGRGEYVRVSPGVQMFSVYGRVVVLHLTVILGGVATSVLGAPVAALIVMVVLKTLLDLFFHLREHRPATLAAA